MARNSTLGRPARSECGRDLAILRGMLRLLRFLAPYRPMLALVLVLAFLQSLANLALPRFMADIVDVGVLQGDIGYIYRTGGIMLLIAVGGTGCAVAASFFSARIAIGFG